MITKKVIYCFGIRLMCTRVLSFFTPAIINKYSDKNTFFPSPPSRIIYVFYTAQHLKIMTFVSDSIVFKHFVLIYTIQFIL